MSDLPPCMCGEEDECARHVGRGHVRSYRIAQSHDLRDGRHRIRNALEDYDFLRTRGVSHEAALERVGLSLAQWENIEKVRWKRAHRERQRAS